jgi:hypothetical protein
MAGVGSGAKTSKLAVLVAELLPTVTLIGPVVAPLGTFTLSCEAEASFTVAAVPLKETLFSVLVVLKFLPVMVTSVPTSPDGGEKLLISTALGSSVGPSSLPQEMYSNNAKMETLANIAFFISKFFGLLFILTPKIDTLEQKKTHQYIDGPYELTDTGFELTEILPGCLIATISFRNFRA